ncbi:divergent PAP2 family protein [Candidatus Minimicrobia naudis]|uniref:Divergent PAP2 family protein n=1 Tax=Candidatus Minimicrobia naudis TaxID=2841263 RepID=A0A8F1MBJ2_9BACT|nr:divergent PAP2 family protein [Candidatus Minimicrobia naudis]
MPSAHSAIVASLAVFLGLQDGWDSSVFGLTTWLAIIVMYDAMMVRYSSGMQGETLNKLIAEQDKAS